MQFITVDELYGHYLKNGQKIGTDTRKIEKGSLFFALKGANFNANEFAEKAIQSGAAIAVVDEAKYANDPRIVLVKDVLSMLQALANHHRRQLKIPVLAITGSNGKTTNKELIAAVLGKKFKTLATEGNLNNHIGVPLTLLKITAAHEFAVVEMGANHQGEIAELCKIADPDFGMITNIGKAHLEGFGGIEGVKIGKGELLVHLKTKGAKAFVNGDDQVLYDLAFGNDKITYGCKKLYDVIGKDYSKSETVSLKFTTRYGEKDFNKLPLIETQIFGHYNLVNCLAAACVGNYFKVDDPLIKEALEEYLPSMNRSQVMKTVKNSLILDAYNANPNSMKAAIENFARSSGSEKIVLLGDMFELGDYSADEHQKIADLLKSLNLLNVVLVGDEFYKVKADEFKKFRTTAECKEYLRQLAVVDHTVLIKGSRGMKMEQLQEVL